MEYMFKRAPRTFASRCGGTQARTSPPKGSPMGTLRRSVYPAGNQIKILQVSRQLLKCKLSRRAPHASGTAASGPHTPAYDHGRVPRLAVGAKSVHCAAYDPSNSTSPRSLSDGSWLARGPLAEGQHATHRDCRDTRRAAAAGRSDGTYAPPWPQISPPVALLRPGCLSGRSCLFSRRPREPRRRAAHAPRPKHRTQHRYLTPRPLPSSPTLRLLSPPPPSSPPLPTPLRSRLPVLAPLQPTP